jgi:hypothetical protein
MTNLFAIRGTDPKIIKDVTDPIGEQNDFYLPYFAQKASLILGAWGTLGTFLNRSAAMGKLNLDIKCLGVTQNNQPKHPLYLKKDTQIQNWNKNNCNDCLIGKDRDYLDQPCWDCLHTTPPKTKFYQPLENSRL